VLAAQSQKPSITGLPGVLSRPGSESPGTTHTQRLKGVIRKLDAGSFDLEMPDTRIFSIQILPGTAQPAGLQTGDGVELVASQDKDGLLQAMSVRPDPKIARTIEVNSQTEPEARRAAALRTILVGPGPQPGDTPSPPGSRQESIEQARAAAWNFLRALPNYICEEHITRYVSETHQPGWNVVDVVTAEVVFEDRKESYRKVAINGKPSKKSPEDSGAWSSGEFGTILGYVFGPASAAEFQYRQEGKIEHHPASIYGFQVDRRHSTWRVQAPGEYILPPYRGSVWIDPQSGHTLRIEMQATGIPKAFPRLTVETAVDYDYLGLGTSEKFLLPVHAEILSCSRTSNQCERNVIEFRGYHKFAGESTVQFRE